MNISRKILFSCLAVILLFTFLAVISLGVYLSLNYYQKYYGSRCYRCMLEQTQPLGRNEVCYYGLGWTPKLLFIHRFRARGDRDSEIAGEQFNELGFRYRPGSLEPKKCNCWVFGGSVMWGINNRTSDCIPNLLEREFGDMKVYNFAYCEATSENGIRILKKHLRDGGRPKCVLWAFGINDSFPGLPECQKTWNRKRRRIFFWRHSHFWWAYRHHPEQAFPANPTAEQIPDIIEKFGQLKSEVVPLSRHLEIHRQVASLAREYKFNLLTVGETFLYENFVRSHNELERLFLKDLKEFAKQYYQTTLQYPDYYKQALNLINLPRYQDQVEIQCHNLNIPFIHMNDGFKLYANQEHDLFHVMDSDGGSVQDPMHTTGEGFKLASIPIVNAVKKIGCFEKRDVCPEPDYSPIKPLDYTFEMEHKYRDSRSNPLFVIINIKQRNFTILEDGVFISKNNEIKNMADRFIRLYQLGNNPFPEWKPFVPNLVIDGTIENGRVMISNPEWEKLEKTIQGREVIAGIFMPGISLG